MKLLLALLLLFAAPAMASYYDDPTSAGRHWKPTPEGVCYENDRVILNCAGLTVTKKRGLFKTMNYWSFAPNQAYVKLRPGEVLAEGQALAIVKAQFTEPFYDRSERRMVKIKGGAVGADLALTAVGLSLGNCSEAGPLKHVPYLGFAIGVGDVVYFDLVARDSPRFFTSSTEYVAYAPAVTHGAAALHTLARCVF